MRVDGAPNIYTCRVLARAGMRLERQNAYPNAQVDVFRAIDWLFPKGLNHHEMFAGVPVAEQVTDMLLTRADAGEFEVEAHPPQARPTERPRDRATGRPRPLATMTR